MKSSQVFSYFTINFEIAEPDLELKGYTTSPTRVSASMSAMVVGDTLVDPLVDPKEMSARGSARKISK